MHVRANRDSRELVAAFVGIAPASMRLGTPRRPLPRVSYRLTGGVGPQDGLTPPIPAERM